MYVHTHTTTHPPTHPPPFIPTQLWHSPPFHIYLESCLSQNSLHTYNSNFTLCASSTCYVGTVKTEGKHESRTWLEDSSYLFLLAKTLDRDTPTANVTIATVMASVITLDICSATGVVEGGGLKR